MHWNFLKHLLRRNNTFLEAVTYTRKDVDLVTVAMHRARQNSHRKPILECLMWAAIPQVAKKNHGCGIASERTGRCSILHTSSPHVLSVGQTHEEPEEHQHAPINIAKSAVKKRGGQKVWQEVVDIWTIFTHVCAPNDAGSDSTLKESIILILTRGNKGETHLHPRFNTFLK